MKVQKRKTKNGAVKQALKLLSDKEHWCQGSSAKDKKGYSTVVDDPNSYQFCASGALQAVCEGEALYHDVYRCVNKVCIAKHHAGMVTINDGKNQDVAHERIIEVFTEAIKVCK